MSDNDCLYVKETFLNLDKNAQFGESPVYESHLSTLGEVFRFAQKEYGRCVSKCYVDLPGEPAKQIGWVFQSRQQYEDARDKNDTYLREVWVEVHSAPPTRSTEYHFAKF